MKCKFCGAELNENDLFCMNCGAAVGNVKKKKKSGGVIVAICIIVVVAIVAVFAVIKGIDLWQDNKNDIPERPSVSVTKEELTWIESTTVAEPISYDFSDIIETTMPTTEAMIEITTGITTETTEKKTVPHFTYDDNDQFLFDSANKYITKDYLSGCSRDEITVILNEIYARHGYIFKDAELRAYFNSQSWYTGTITSLEEAASHFNSIEQKNVDTIYAYQKSMGWRS